MNLEPRPKKQTPLNNICALLLISALALHGQTPDYSARLKGFDEWLTQAVVDGKVPGLAIAIVADGQVIHSKGYGYRDLKQKLPVTPRTLFAIGSITKSFTVATLGTLADEGKFEWDKPVREYLPGFRMYDATTTEQLTTRDMVTHRSGLPRHDLVWYTSEFPLESLVQRLRHLPPSKPLRSKFQYNNLMYNTAGYIASQIGEKPWPELVRERIFGPLGMTYSRMSLEDAATGDELALPYKRDFKSNGVEEVPPFKNMTVAPAGSIYSCVEDMAKYVRMHIDQGKFGGKTVVGQNTIRQMQSAQISTDWTSPYPEIEGSAYGMGLTVNYYRGHKQVGHGGAIDGMRATMSFLLKEKLGVVVLWNLSGSALGDNLQYAVFDRLLDAPAVDWVGRTKASESSVLAAMKAAEGQGLTGQRKGTKPSHELTDYLGSYEHPGYGRIGIKMAGSGLAMGFNRIERPLEHFHYDTFQVPAKTFDQFEHFKLTFVTNVEGDVVRLRANLDPNVAETEFDRVADPRMFERSFLNRLVGQYEGSPQPTVITLRGESQLLLSRGEGEGSKLIPLFGTRFRVDGQTENSVEFRLNGAGEATELAIYTPGQVFVRAKIK
jgi:CubicO group peptidase (beta-lactamase class C family)